MRRPAPLGYRAAIDWIAQNDDTYWLDNENGLPSVTACLVADLYHRTIEEVTADLRRRVEQVRR